MAHVLCLNHGSSSLKFALYYLQSGTETRLLAGKEEVSDIGAAILKTREALNLDGLPKVSAVGHRVVHGGPDFIGPRKVTPELISALNLCVAFAPLHLPPQLELIRM